MGNSGNWIRQVREQRGFTREQVEKLTYDFAQKTGNEHNWVRHGRLAHIEAGDAVPDIYTVQSFAEVYQITYERVLQGFGIDIAAGRHLLGISLGTPTPGSRTGMMEPHRIGLSSLRQMNTSETRLVTDPRERAVVLRNILGLEFDEEFTRIGLIGSTDDSMGPYVPAGSTVKIDTRYKAVESRQWHDLVERPIYFFWHEQGYSCCWCDQKDNKVMLVPHPASHRSVMQLMIPSQVEIIGRVTHVWSPLPGMEAAK